jgi:hypothetical protein
MPERRQRLGQPYAAVHPPSIDSIAPVIDAAASLAR